MSQTNVPVLDQSVPRSRRRHRRALALVLLVAIAIAAVVTWLRVAHTIRHPDPVVVAKQPRVNALVWSRRVFVDAASFKLWLDAHDLSFAEWARQHPKALVVFRRRPARER